MSDPALHDEHWIAPLGAGPRRGVLAAAGLLALALLGLWALIVTGTLTGGAGDARAVTVVVAADGTVTVNGSAAASPELRTRGRTEFLVIHERRISTGDARVTLDLTLPAGVERERVATWLVPDGRTSDTELLVVVPADALAAFDGGGEQGAAAGTVAAITQPVDRRARAARSDARLHDALTGGWWWILPLGALGTGVLPAWLWRRSARRFFSMRVPGAGTTMSAGPPSELDALNVAVLVAGAGPVDVGDAFAGHVLDLVERRQLVIRRTLDPALGAGAVIGLVQADEDDVVRMDPAVAVLRSMAEADGTTVPLPDSPTKRRRAGLDELVSFELLVEARSRFARLTDAAPTRRIGVAAGLLACICVAGIVTGIVGPRPGLRDAGWLALTLGLPAALLVGLWLRDARSWRRVTRARRNERAQWLAWTRAVNDPADAEAAYDVRNLPLLVAAGGGDALVPSAAGPDAVELAAVTARTIATLRAVVE